jgi:hypothetical protein
MKACGVSSWRNGGVMAKWRHRNGEMAKANQSSAAAAAAIWRHRNGEMKEKPCRRKPK